MDAAINNEFESAKQDSNAEFVAKLARDGVMKKWRQGLIKELKEIGHSGTYSKFASSKITVNFEITEQDKEERKAHRYQEDCLTGTDKQIAWAKDIRKSIVQAHGGTSDNERDEFLKVCKKIKKSKFWIDHRHLEHKLQPPGVDVKAYIIECSEKVKN